MSLTLFVALDNASCWLEEELEKLLLLVEDDDLLARADSSSLCSSNKRAVSLSSEGLVLRDPPLLLPLLLRARDIFVSDSL
jgi:hypothetical protein